VFIFVLVLLLLFMLVLTFVLSFNIIVLFVLLNGSFLNVIVILLFEVGFVYLAFCLKGKSFTAQVSQKEDNQGVIQNRVNKYKQINDTSSEYKVLNVQDIPF